MTNPNFEQPDKTEKPPLREEVFLGIVQAIQNLGCYGEYSRNNIPAFGNVIVENNVIVIEEDVPLALRPTHQDSGKLYVSEDVEDEVPFLFRMRVWTPFEGAVSNVVTINGRQEHIRNVWQDETVGSEHSNTNMITTASQRIYQEYYSIDSFTDDLVMEEADNDRMAQLELQELQGYVKNLAETYPEVAERIKRVF